MSNTATSYAQHIQNYMTFNMGCKRRLRNFGITFLAMMVVFFILYLFFSNIMTFPKGINVTFYIIWTGLLIVYLFHELPYKATYKVWNALNKFLKPSPSL